MSIKISDKFSVEFEQDVVKRPEYRINVIKNLKKLYELLPEYMKVLLEDEGCTFVFFRGDADSVGYFDDEHRQKIFLHAKWFSDIKNPANTRYALATLKEEIWHKLAEDFQYDCSDPWLGASRKEMETTNYARDRLIREESRYNRDAKGGERYLYSYAHEEIPAELLVQILLTRDYLIDAQKGEEIDLMSINDRLVEAFPNTCRLAMQFEELCEAKAEKIHASLTRQR